MATYYTPASPVTTEGYFVSPESRVLIGNANMYGSLEVSSWTYSTYGASIGLQSGTGIDVGELESLSFSHVPSFSAIESANIRTSNIYVLDGEETAVSIGLRQFHPHLLWMALGTGTQYVLGDERLITFGDLCENVSRPLSIEFSNVSCQAPQVADIAAGVTGGVITLYDTFMSTGFPWDDMNAGELNNISVELKAKPVLAKARGNRLGNVYLY